MKSSKHLDGKPNYALIRNLEIELGFEPYPELPKAQLYGSASPPSAALADAILKDIYAYQHTKHN
jgi:hypothetical protein